MAIARSTRPSVIVIGDTERISPRTNKEGRLWAHDVTIRQPSGAGIAVRYFVREDSAIFPPGVGEQVAVECTVEESREYGSSLIYERDAAAALDSLVGA